MKRHIFIYLMFLFSTAAYAFNGLTHQELIKSALDHLDSFVETSQATRQWLGTENTKRGRRIRNLLIRATVDEDYRANIFLDANFHSPFAGAMGKAANIFTTFSHHLNVSIPGTYWEFDGYAYKNTDGTGNDKYLGLPSVSVKGALSNALSSRIHSGFIDDNDIGTYQLEFKGTQQDWQNMFFGNNRASDAVFPPANVPAQLAKDRLMSSPIAKKGRKKVWAETINLASGVFSSQELSRRFWRAEIEGLPQAFDLLGTIFHMTQDLSVPHHTHGIGSYCHEELETLGDTLACGKRVDTSLFDLGIYDENPNYYKCQRLYDPALVETLRTHLPVFSTRPDLSLSNRLKEIAKLTSQWRFGKDPRDEDLVRSVLPNGLVFFEKSCNELLKHKELRSALKVQYNFAVAATVVVFDQIAKEYLKIP